MTPKEKAEELVDKFYYPSLKWSLKHAKENAIKCVDEILESFPVKTISDCEKRDYWVTVKTEIENL
jgi:hypothetical protein